VHASPEPFEIEVRTRERCSSLRFVVDPDDDHATVVAHGHARNLSGERSRGRLVPIPDRDAPTTCRHGARLLLEVHDLGLDIRGARARSDGSNGIEGSSTTRMSIHDGEKCSITLLQRHRLLAGARGRRS
jgi:hypothetical protein